MQRTTDTIQKLHTWSYLCAICAIILSFGFWTWVVTQWYVSASAGTQGGIAALRDTQMQGQSHPMPVTASLLTQESDSSNQQQPSPGHTSAPVAPSEEVPAVVSEEETELQEWGLTSVYTLSIPKIGVRTSVFQPARTYWDRMEWNLLEEQMQVGLSYGAVAYPHSVQPGRRGTAIIAGHSSPPDARAQQSAYGQLFRKLPALEEGDTISILRGENFVDYTVESIAVVSANATGILEQQSRQSVLKLITCYPIGTTKERWVVTAVQANAG
ncbi:MAG: sortase [Candidatus Peribacteraceae bacterium]|nr:sortase [Candidatus Peribacteraceae bacterium]